MSTVRRRRPSPVQGRPTVTVVVPCYNYGHYLPECVASALDQDDVAVDVIVVDDASPDGSVDVAHALAAQDARVRVIAHDVNRGHIRTYNDGLDEATGEFVVLLSADDLLTPGSLGRAVAVMQADPQVGLVYGNPLEFSDEPPPARTEATSWSVWPGPEWVARMCTRGHNIIFTPEAVMRTSVWRRIGGYDARFPHSADMLVWLQAATHADVARVNGADQAYYRVHGNNMHLEDFGEPLADVRERAATFDAFFGTTGRQLAGWPQLAERARRSVARNALDTGRRRLDDGHVEVDVLHGGRELSLLLGNRPSLLAQVLDASRERRALSGRPPSVLQRGARTARSLRWRMHWQRWYRWGT